MIFLSENVGLRLFCERCAMGNHDGERLPGLARVPEAERYLSVSRATVYALMERGELPYVKLGKSRRIPWAALEALVARNTVAR